MNYRTLGKTGFQISDIALGTWQVGGRWGEEFDNSTAERILNQAIDRGINFIDTADVYSDGLSEAAVGRVVRSRNERIYVATKCGRRLQPHTSSAYQMAALRGFVEDSLRNTGLEALDLIQLHCPPTEVYYRPELFGLFEDLKREGKILNLGVSVEKVEEALKAIEFPNVTSVQIIFNSFRQRPADLFFKEASKRQVGIIARVPLASGLLSGKFNSSTVFTSGDHRQFNRNGEAFDKGETFSGINYDLGLQAVERIRALLPSGDASMAQIALRWILMFPEVSCTIPGASSPEQLISNISASTLPALSPETMHAFREVYDSLIRPSVHHLW